MANLVFIGPSIGLGIGCLVNGIHHRNIFKTSKIKDLGRFRQISLMCESLRFKSSSWGKLVKKLLLVEILPLIFATIEFVGKQLLASTSFRESLLQGGIFLAKIASFSCIHTLSLMCLGFLVIATVKEIIKSRSKCDPSGHAITVCWNTMLRYSTFNAMNSLGSYSFTYLAFTGIMSLAEGVWIYDTTVNFHSIADMVVGTSLGVLTVAFDAAFGLPGTLVITACAFVALKVSHVCSKGGF